MVSKNVQSSASKASGASLAGQTFGAATGPPGLSEARGLVPRRERRTVVSCGCEATSPDEQRMSHTSMCDARRRPRSAAAALHLS